MQSLQEGHSTSINSNAQNNEEGDHVRDIHELIPQPPPPPPPRHRNTWSMSTSSDVASFTTENFTTMSREFNALVIAGSSLEDNNHNISNNNNNDLTRIGEDDPVEETNPLAIVPDTSGYDPPGPPGQETRRVGSETGHEITVQRVKREEVDAKITAWQNAKIAKINNRFKREDAIINGWESEKTQKATSTMKKVERKLEEKRARALEKMQNDVAKAHRKAEERRASAEGKRGTKVARVLEIANLMRAVGRPPAKRSFFSY